MLISHCVPKPKVPTHHMLLWNICTQWKHTFNNCSLPPVNSTLGNFPLHFTTTTAALLQSDVYCLSSVTLPGTWLYAASESNHSFTLHITSLTLYSSGLSSWWIAAEMLVCWEPGWRNCPCFSSRWTAAEMLVCWELGWRAAPVTQGLGSSTQGAGIISRQDLRSFAGGWPSSLMYWQRIVQLAINDVQCQGTSVSKQPARPVLCNLTVGAVAHNLAIINHSTRMRCPCTWPYWYCCLWSSWWDNPLCTWPYWYCWLRNSWRDNPLFPTQASWQQHLNIAVTKQKYG